MTVKSEVANKIMRHLEKEYPNASLALNFNSPLELLVATVLSAQCTDKRVNEVTRNLFKTYKNAEAFARVRINVLEKDVSSISFFRNKAKNIKECCKIIVGKYDSEVPSDIKILTSLPGIGRKTANIVLGNAFGQPAIAVDTHVQRVSIRLVLATAKNADNIEKELCEVIPKNKWTKTCHLFQAHGRTTCTAKNPSCPKCVLFNLCKWEEKSKEF